MLCCFPGICGIFTALLELFVWLFCLFSQKFFGCNCAMGPKLLWWTDFFLTYYYSFTPLFSTCLYSSPYQAGVHTIPLSSITSKGRLECMDRTQECVGRAENKGKWRACFVQVRWKTKSRRENGKIQCEDMKHTPSTSPCLILFYFLFFLLSVPQALGVFV